jgi:hypothetical protein
MFLHIEFADLKYSFLYTITPPDQESNPYFTVPVHRNNTGCCRIVFAGKFQYFIQLIPIIGEDTTKRPLLGIGPDQTVVIFSANGYQLPGIFPGLISVLHFGHRKTRSRRHFNEN